MGLLTRLSGPLLLVLAAFSGCFSPGEPAGALLCGTQGECPAGFECHQDRCWRVGEYLEVDGGVTVPDAAASADAAPVVPDAIIPLEIDAGDPTRGACEDGVDNDGDGSTDTSDPGCTSALDSTERGTLACDDGVDNDGDGSADARIDGVGDPGCTSPADASELGTAQCDDGLDNDADGRTDFKVDASRRDLGCTGPGDSDEHGTAQCDDGIDNDCDGRIDGYGSQRDPGCFSVGDNDEHGTAQCDDGRDNDGDGKIDFRVSLMCGAPGDPDCDKPERNREDGD